MLDSQYLYTMLNQLPQGYSTKGTNPKIETMKNKSITSKLFAKSFKKIEKRPNKIKCCIFPLITHFVHLYIFFPQTVVKKYLK